MPYFRPFLAAVVAVCLIFITIYPIFAAHAPIGVLTLATHAHLGEATAFSGLSVFEGERLSTDAQRRLGMRAGRSTLTLGQNTAVELISVEGGLHVDMSAGSVHFSAVDKEFVDVHAEDTMVRPSGVQVTQALVTMLGPQVLQITAEHGSLDFSCRDEFRNLPEGQTYRIYLDARTGPEDGDASGAQKAGRARKVTYFIIGAGVAGVTAWGIYDALKSGNAPISPAKP